ncbi:MAG: ABC transporter ATP-binding protein [Agathobacter sp.]|nr:ABC transporter ATP-binding protein [Agathobacter sp.]
MEAIKIENLTKYYGKTRGIEQVSMTVEKGEFFGFIGPNGAGKSTTIRTLLGLIAPTNGTAQMLGFDIKKEKVELLSHIGYLPSEAVFYSGMKVKDVLKLSANLHKKDCGKVAEELCQRLQLDINKKVEELSFGNRKKVAIVCALQHEPELLLLDEPTSGLDPLMQKEFYEILKERNKAGATIFLSSHILSEIQRYCTKAAIIRNGRIIACDSVDKLSQTNTKRVSVVGEITLDELEGVRDVQHTDGAWNFLYGGDVDALLGVLAKSHIQDISISEPDLDEIFMHYYEDGGVER